MISAENVAAIIAVGGGETISVGEGVAEAGGVTEIVTKIMNILMIMLQGGGNTQVSPMVYDPGVLGFQSRNSRRNGMPRMQKFSPERNFVEIAHL
mmetsp:Transcript_29800/g.72004  ORF Transcript_29800/g.72004 Transcript_29800/m.72004 type:complete len:95 (+) Transcript_29800:112-396(+)